MDSKQVQELYTKAQNFQNGTVGFVKDIDKARSIYTELAENGVPEAQIALGKMEYDKKEIEKAVMWYEQAAGKGNVEALALLGKLWLYEEDYARAAWYLSKSSDAGDIESKNLLGLLYFRGCGIVKDEEKGLSLILESANGGWTMAQRSAGYIFKHGLNGECDYEKAMYWYSEATKNGCDMSPELENLQTEKQLFNKLVKSSENGDPELKYKIAKCYLKGKGVQLDYTQAVKYLRDAVNHNSPNAMCTLGWCYYNGKGVEKDTSIAFELYLRAAEMGQIDAQNNVGWCYAHGIGVEQDYFKAVEWYKQAADRTKQHIDDIKKSVADKQKLLKLIQNIEKSDIIPGEVSAQKNLAWCLQHHLGTDLPQANADKEAFKFYKSAAMKGDLEAMCSLAFFYKKGIGVEKNIALAKKWYSSAALNQEPTAHCNLGWFYERGIGDLKPNINKAIFHYRQAAAQGIKKAQERLDALMKQAK